MKAFFCVCLMVLSLLSAGQPLRTNEWLDFTSYPGVKFIAPTSLLCLKDNEFFKVGSSFIDIAFRGYTYVLVADSKKDSIIVLQVKITNTTREVKKVTTFKTRPNPVHICEGFNFGDGKLQVFVLSQPRDTVGYLQMFVLDPLSKNFTKIKEVETGWGTRECVVHSLPTSENHFCYIINENAYDAHPLPRQIQGVFAKVRRSHGTMSIEYFHEPTENCSSNGKLGGRLLTGPGDIEILNRKILILDFNNKRIFIYDRTREWINCANVTLADTFKTYSTERLIKLENSETIISPSPLLFPSKIFGTGNQQSFLLSVFNGSSGSHGILLYDKDWERFTAVYRENLRYFSSTISGSTGRLSLPVTMVEHTQSYWAYLGHGDIKGVTKFEIPRTTRVTYSNAIINGSENINAYDLKIKLVDKAGIRTSDGRESREPDLFVADPVNGKVYLCGQ
ncbi:MAG: hypothetical protein SFW35_01255 [Chitinophagales bacterium]|nr:hypothetical protein [Chitinophagales bacterium]